MRRCRFLCVSGRGWSVLAKPRDFPHKAQSSFGGAIAFFKVGWDQLASSAGPPSSNVENCWWAGAAKRRWSHPTFCPTSKTHWPCLSSHPTSQLKRTEQKRRGFTLVETLAALLLCGIVLSVAFSTILHDERVRAAGERQVSRNARTWGVIEDISSDLRNCIAPIAKPLPAGMGSPAESSFPSNIGERVLDVHERFLDLNLPSAVEPIGFVGESDALVLHVAGASTRFDDSHSQHPASRERIVAYAVSRGEALSLPLEREQGRRKQRKVETGEAVGLVRVQRAAWPVVDGDSTRETDRAGNVSLVSSDIVAVSFRYFDGHNWSDRWDGHRLRKLPRCVEITAWFAEDDAPRSFVVSLPSRGSER